MAHRSSLAFLLLAALFAILSIRADRYFDYYVLSLTWPGAYCRQTEDGCCKPTTGYPEKDFFITSFATYSEATNKPVTECIDKPFEFHEVDDLYHDLEVFWSNIKCPSNDGLATWKNAWDTHGVCTNLTEKQYFHAALKARRVANVLKRLRDRSIFAGNGLYNLEDVRAALRRKLGPTPAVQCSKSPYDIEGLFQIYKVFLCFSNTGVVRECPPIFNFTCSSYVQYMPFEYSMLKSSASADTLHGRGGNPIRMPASFR